MVIQRANYLFSQMIIGLLLLSVGGCASLLAHERPLTCVPPEGSLDVTVGAGLVRTVYHWTSTGITLKGKRNLRTDPMERSNTWKISGGSPAKWKVSRTGVEQSLLGDEWILNSAYDVNPDGTLLASAVFPAHFHWATNRLALIDRKEQRVVHFLELPYHVSALAWSPSGQTLAVYFEEDVTKSTFKSFKAWFAGFIGHPPSYSTIRIAFYNLDGQQICEQLLEEKIPNGSGYVTWHPE